VHPQLNIGLAAARQQDLLETAARVSRGRRAGREAAKPGGSPLFAGVTLRLATGADGPALARLANLEQAQRPREPVLLGVVMSRPVAALSLRDGSLVARPHTAELVELLRLRATQLARR